MIEKINRFIFGITEEEYIAKYHKTKEYSIEREELIKEAIKADHRREIAVSLLSLTLFLPIFVFFKVYKSEFL